ncbi:MAG: D-tyrosyl-tRNA(Tyr) deacylase [Candidatus Omnitrophica bacterium]|nr:D-tyrosyl-tRNA(Tyr) deacylase [Candidatus Omnitrophota bacterium]
MKLLIQRVKQADVKVDKKVVGAIGKGILIFLGISKKDSINLADYFVQKICDLRIFDDTEGKMNLSALDIKSEFLVVSQFTLYGDCSKGRRPSFDQAAEPAEAERIYHYFVEQLKLQGLKVETGRFRATMEVSLVNDGPVTFMLES